VKNAVLAIFCFCFIEGSIPIQTVQYDGLIERLNLSSDTTYVVNFWATWCKPCVAELPVFESLHQQSSNKPIKVILVSLDFPDQIDNRLIPFTKQRQIQSEVILLDDPDANTWIPKVDKNWSGSIPATWILRGKKKQFHEGSLDSLELNNQLQKVL
jgi:thiol-disulfide isomerase/thioredoxin